MPEVLQDGPWDKGVDSSTFSLLLPKGAYPWSQNTVNTGAVISTRQGVYEVTKSTVGPPRGITVFKPLGGQPHIVVSLANGIYHTPYPFSAPLARIAGLNFNNNSRRVYFEVATQAQKTKPNGEIEILPNPKPVLMIQDGSSQAGYWDGTTAAHLTFWPDKEVPVGTWMKWIGGRLWVMQNNKIYVSDINNPLQFTEHFDLNQGGFLVLPGQGTGLGVTFDYKTLLAFTDLTTTAIQAGITDRSTWSRTQDFQRVMFPNIGCVSGRTFVNQYGISWWMSHNGVIGLDNALQTYQTSSIHVKDQNMARSKSGVTNWAGGGCGGTFGNFLFFSVPSGSTYNKHTWVMDQTVLSTLQRELPAAWAANWTGIRPEEWVTAIINGRQRCFCISYDPVPSGYQSTVWEAFIGQRQDVPRAAQIGEKHAHDIACSWESKFLALSPTQYMRFRYAELDIAEIQGRVNIEVFYCGLRTSYKSILKKKLYARPAGFADDEDFNPDTIVGVAKPQSRVLKTRTDIHEEDDNNPEVQTEHLRSIDRAFSLLVTWTGRMTLEGIRMFVDPEGQFMEGIAEADELTDRWIDAEGHGAITQNPTLPNKTTAQTQSQTLEVFTPRWVEFPAYDAATANGVFFCVIPTYSPPAGVFDVTWPMNVNITSETSGCEIIYTTDGSAPTYANAQHYHGTKINNGGVASVPQHRHLKAIAVREGLTNSAIQDGLYDKPTVVNPTFSPVAGGYDQSTYPKVVTISTTTPNSRIRYTLNGVNPTRDLGTLIPTSSGNTTINVPPKTLKAMAYQLDNSHYDSGVTTGRYFAKPLVATPTIVPNGGDFQSYPVSFHLNCATSGSHIRYTIDGTTPTEEHGTLVNPGAQRSIPAPATVKAIAFKAECTTSAVRSAVFTQNSTNVTEPTFDPEGGHYGLSLTVHIHTDTLGATIYYTKDGSDPRPGNNQAIHVEASDAYVGFNFPSPATRTLRARAFKVGLIESPEHSAIYHFGN